MKLKTNPIADSLDDIKILQANGFAVNASTIANKNILFDITTPAGDEFNVLKEENAYLIYKTRPVVQSGPSITSTNLLDAVMTNEYELTEQLIDNKNGTGQVPWNMEIDYRGLKVLMKPSIFLKIAQPMGTPKSAEYFIEHFKNNGTIGAPFLSVNIPNEWKNGDFTKSAYCCGHEGRNRMFAIREYYGDTPIEVHIFPNGALNRASNLNADIIENLRAGIFKENEDVLVENIFQNFNKMCHQANAKEFRI